MLKDQFYWRKKCVVFRQSIFSWAVILGLVLEGPELIYEILSIARSRIQRFRYRIVLIENRIELAKALAFVGWIFIIGGLFGELRASSRIADLSASIQECSDAKVTKATLEAGDAAASARTAHEEADAVGKEAAALILQLGAVAKRATDIDFNLGMTQWALSERYVLESDSLVKQLRQFKGQSVYISSYVTGEGYFFCSALYFFAHSAEMNAANGCETVPLSIPPSTGVAISGPDIQQTLALSQILLHTTNLGPSGVASAIKAPVLSIFVGVKSPFVIPQARGVKAPTQKKTTRQNAKP